ncbi:MAG TPA: Rossmann fold nucleotide-binding protein [Ornithinibacter sp.]|nr:Rossmann fold nucleotide-binding protein [Ornithinibacter sp.]
MREIESLTALHAALHSERPLAGLRLQDLDLGGHERELLARTDVRGLVVLGGRMSDELATHLRANGAFVFPTDPGAPVTPYRSSLYQPHELYAGLREHGYEATPDARAYHWARDGALAHDAFVTLLRAIHDDSISDALDEVLDGVPVVGVMGGHALHRDTEAYAGAARLGHALACAGLTVATGGGPGAMEAANLGAFAASPDALDDALARLHGIPSFHPGIEAWAGVARDVHDDLVRVPVAPAAVRSIGIPTWFYGHEPPNVFCTGIAKYFSNAIREDGLLARCTAGLVVLEGAAGTVQEVFQAATRLYYAAQDEALPAVVLVGRRHWTESIPVWPALQALAAGRAMAGRIHLVDSTGEAADLLLAAAGR